MFKRPATRKLLLASALVLAAVLTLAATNPSTTPYAASYTDALTRYPGHAPVRDQALELFLRHFTELQLLSPAQSERLYAPNGYFSDTLITTQDRASLVRHINGLREADADVTVHVIDTLRKNADVYLVWSMRATFKPIASSVTSNSIGVTHLRFNEAGQVVLQQDFWDSAEGFYKQVPLLGSLIRRIGERFQDNG